MVSISKELKSIVQFEQNNLESLKTSKYAEIEANPKYSLVVDPDDKYHMSDDQKEFIKAYIQVKNIPLAAEISGIEMDTARVYFFAQSSQDEISRINEALYKRQFSMRLLTLNELAGYLTSQLTDMNVPLGDRLAPSEKIRVAQMLIDLNKLRLDVQTASAEDKTSINEQIKKLSVDTIKQLLGQSENTTLSKEETDYLKSLPPEELLSMLNDINKQGGDK